MVLDFLGDSITEGCCASSPELNYVSLVGKMLGCEAINHGVSGTRIARQRVIKFEIWDKGDYNYRSQFLNPNADKVFVFGGTNDFGHGDAPIGEPDSRDLYTFYGAMNVLLENLKNRYGAEKICVILPLHRVGEDNPLGEGSRTDETVPLMEYVRIEREVAAKYMIDVLDFNDIFTPEKLSVLTTDGLHPNDEGHKIIAEGICNYIKMK